MGVNVSFYHNGTPAGAASFSAFTLKRQRGLYGLDFADCLTYDVDGAEMVGAPDVAPVDDADLSSPWRPNWTRGLERAERLLLLATRAGNEYDLSRLPAFVGLVRRAAQEPDRWTVTWSD